MYELAISTTLFTSMLESAAAEQSSRMNAMEVRTPHTNRLTQTMVASLGVWCGCGWGPTLPRPN
jgi:F0F1-type ATP synthase gamma subunit